MRLPFLPLPLLILAFLVLASGCDTESTDTLIVPYTGPVLTEADAVVPNPPFSPARWSGSLFDGRMGQSVLLSRSTQCGDECSRTVRFTFRDAMPTQPSGLPESVEGVFERRQGNPDGFESRPLAITRVEIQDWGPEVYSGVVVTPSRDAPSADGRIVFWADELPAAAE